LPVESAAKAARQVLHAGREQHVHPDQRSRSSAAWYFPTGHVATSEVCMRTVTAVLLSAALVAAAPAAIAQHHDHHAPAAAPATPAQRFATDATLRQEMQGIRAAVGGLDHYQHNHTGPQQAVQLAGKIEEHVRTIIAQCKLPPDADAALHTIIVPLMQNAGALKKDPTNLAPIAPMHEALAQYARQFDDPAFAAAK
jgi:hypothetical protein